MHAFSGERIISRHSLLRIFLRVGAPLPFPDSGVVPASPSVWGTLVGFLVLFEIQGHEPKDKSMNEIMNLQRVDEKKRQLLSCYYYIRACSRVILFGIFHPVFGTAKLC